MHVTARLKEYGKAVRQLSRKEMIRTAVLPNQYLPASAFATQIGDLLHIKCKPLPSFLCASLAPSNPILHTSRLYSLFQDYSGAGYHQRLYMYDTWDDKTSECLFSCDDELQEICRRLAFLGLSEVPSLKKYYESDSVRAFTEKIRSIKAFHGAEVPMVLRNGSLHPDFSSRYFTADFAYGLQFIREIGQCCGVPMPEISKVLGWYERVTGTQLVDRIKDHSEEWLYEFYIGKNAYSC